MHCSFRVMCFNLRGHAQYTPSRIKFSPFKHVSSLSLSLSNTSRLSLFLSLITSATPPPAPTKSPAQPPSSFSLTSDLLSRLSPSSPPPSPIPQALISRSPSMTGMEVGSAFLIAYGAACREQEAITNDLAMTTEQIMKLREEISARKLNLTAPERRLKDLENRDRLIQTNANCIIKSQRLAELS